MTGCGLTQGQALDAAARTLRASPATANKATLQRLAESAATSQEGALASLALGLAALDTGNTPEALRRITAANRRLPQLGDYLAWWTAQTHAKAQNPVAIPAALDLVWGYSPVSPIAGSAAIMAARSLLDQQKHTEATALLVRMQAALPQAQGMALLAEAAQMRGDLTAAAAHWQSVYYGFPVTPEAGQARDALANLQAKMGSSYPPPMPQSRLERAGILLEARQYAVARLEYQRLSNELAGRERDLAKVRVGAADYRARRSQPALTYLRTISVSNPEAAAERLYWLAAAARRLERLDEMQAALAEMARKHKTSPWRLKALMESANPYLLQNEANVFVPMYRACAQDFPNQPEAHLCSWRALWRVWLDRKPEAEVLLRDHLVKFPASDTAAPAFYFLGRAAERRGDAGAAKVWWQEVSRRFPNSYYTVLAKKALEDARFAAAAESPEARQLADAMELAPRTPPDFTPTAASTRRLERARLLTRIAMDALADGELRYGARNDAQPFLMAMELSERSNRLGEPARGLRLFKSTASGYLSLNRADAPERFWRAAFPFPYRTSIERHAAANGLDPYVLAGLIRQESEFDATVVSYARAIGLTQVLPSTGREISRRMRLRGYSPSRLKEVDFNLQLGTNYLKMLINSFDGRVEPALASYNGGKSRVDRWLRWGDFHEMAELMETIPIEQTREYGKIILRNAEIYRALYPQGTAGSTWASPDPETVKKLKPQPVPKKPVARPKSKGKATPKKATSGAKQR